MKRCYVGRCKCGSIMAAMVDNPDRKEDVAESVAEFIKCGLTIEQMDVEKVGVTLQLCKCPKQQLRKKKDLPTFEDVKGIFRQKTDEKNEQGE